MSVPSCACGNPGAYSLTPGEWIDHRTEEPCVIVRSRLTTDPASEEATNE